MNDSLWKSFPPGLPRSPDEKPFEYGLLHVEPVLGLVPDDGVRPLEDPFGYLLPPVRGGPNGRLLRGLYELYPCRGLFHNPFKERGIRPIAFRAGEFQVKPQNACRLDP